MQLRSALEKIRVEHAVMSADLEVLREQLASESSRVQDVVARAAGTDSATEVELQHTRSLIEQMKQQVCTT
jgi:hypothetical protein